MDDLRSSGIGAGGGPATPGWTPPGPPKRSLVRRFFLPDRFNQGDELEAEIREAGERVQEIKAGDNDTLEAKAERVAHHLKTAEAALAEGRTGLVMRELAYAQQETIANLPSSRGATAIAELRAEIEAELPDEGQRTALLARVDEATKLQRAAPGGTEWRNMLFAAKIQCDHIVVGLYQARERARDAIALLGGELAVVILLFFLTARWRHATSTADTWFQVGEISASRALWAGFLAGAFGACLRSLYGVAANRGVPGRYETLAATAVRPLVGGSAGFLAVIMLASGLFNLGDAKVVTMFVVCIGAGALGERVLMGPLEIIMRASAKGDTAPPTSGGTVPKVVASGGKPGEKADDKPGGNDGTEEPKPGP
jgi:hypothetical protein